MKASPRKPARRTTNKAPAQPIPAPIVTREPIYRIDFQLPGLPPMTNARGSRHWRVIHRERTEWKLLVWKVAGTSRPAKPLFKAKLTLVRYSCEAPDPDGLVSGFKAVIDGLRECGILHDDKFVNIGMPTYHWLEVPRGQGHIRVIVEEA